MRVGSLFSGVGLGDLGLTLAGMEIVFQVEIEPYARKVLDLRWPDVPKFGDIREVKGSDTPPCDLLAGGFPCQDISTAGKGAGIEGERSGLWKEFARLICEIRPRYVLVENVSALLGRGLGVVLGDLAEIGYDTEWDCIPASAVGAPHRRDRVWIVAYPKSTGTRENKQRLRSVSNGHCEGLQISYPASKRLSYRAEETVFRPSPNKKPERSNWWSTEPNMGRVAHGVSSRVDRLKGLGNGQVVQVVRYVGERILAFDKGMR